jgi:hypothetical protein
MNASLPKAWHGVRRTTSCLAFTYVTGSPGSGTGASSAAGGASSAGGTSTTGGVSLSGAERPAPAVWFRRRTPVLLRGTRWPPPRLRSLRSQQGQTLYALPGTWSVQPAAYSYASEDCDSSGASCVDIAGAAAGTGTLTVNANHQITDTFPNAYQTQIIGPIPYQ